MDVITLAVAKKLAESGTGTPGKDGKSAYEIAVENGFEGTEEEWLASLKGESVDISELEEAINNKPGEKIADGGEIFNDYEDNIASGICSHAEGYRTTASGGYSHAEGIGTIASGDGTTVSGAHAEGQDTTASGISSHSEGWNTQASGTGSHAEGYSTEASGGYSHAEGIGTIASGGYSHAEGVHAEATGEGSHAEGEYTIAASKAQHVQGRYNIEDSAGIYAHIVGWGENSRNRENIHTITTTGDGWFAGKVSAGTENSPATPTADNDLITKKYFDDNVGNVALNYDSLNNRPSIAGVVLSGDQSLSDFGIQASSDSALETSAKTIVGAINELVEKINALTPAENESILTVTTGSSE